MTLKPLYLLVLFVACISCHSGDQESVRTGMQFRVDSAQLSDAVRIADYKLQYCPPAGWKSHDTDVFQERIDSQYSSQFKNIVGVYKDTASTAFLIVSILPDTLASVTRPQGDSIALFGNEPWQDVRRGQFEHQGLAFTQYLLQSSGWVSFRLFVGQADPNVRFDYIVSRNIYQDEIKKIESSIGSIAHL